MQLLPSWNFPTFLFYSLLYSHFYYCIISWASTYQTNLHRLFILQKRLLKSLNISQFKSHPWRNLVNKTSFASTGPIYVFNCKNSFFPPPRFKNNSPKATISLLQYYKFQSYCLPYCQENSKNFSDWVFSRIQDSFKFTWQRGHQLSIMVINKDSNAN